MNMKEDVLVLSQNILRRKYRRIFVPGMTVFCMINKRTKALWMRVTKDIYELPLCVCDTAADLGRAMGLKDGCHGIVSAIQHAKTSGGKCQYVRVELTDEDIKEVEEYEQLHREDECN